MKVAILYHPHSDHARNVEEYARDFKQQQQHDLELISLESREGADKAKLYDIVRYPAVMALSEGGELLRAWQGPVLPVMNELAFYTKS